MSAFGESRQKSAHTSVASAFDWPVLWGLGGTFLFYGALPYLPAHRDLALRYFCSHWIEYTTTGLFFVGLALLARKALHLIRERQAIATVEEVAFSRSSEAHAADEFIETLPSHLQQTAIGERLQDAADHLESPQRGSLGDHLKYLAELAAERLHGSFALLRTICWAIPILGFLGTVMGITLAIANINPEQLSSSLGDVTGGLAVAFDTTALALALSLVLVFATFVVERSEQAVLDRVEAFALKRLAPLAPAVPPSPLEEAESKAATELVERTEALIRSQTETWQGAIESMRTRWAETIVEQQGQIRDSLAAGMELTLSDHAAGLRHAREDLVSAVSACTDRLERSLTENNRERARQLETFSADLHSLWNRCRGDLDDLQERYQRTLAEAVATVGSDLQAWRADMQGSAKIATEQRAELSRQSKLLIQMAEQSSDLFQIENRLSDNLESLRATETLQEAVHSLTAAAHLLTARTPRSRAA